LRWELVPHGQNFARWWTKHNLAEGLWKLLVLLLVAFHKH